MKQAVFPGFEFLLRNTQEIMHEYTAAQTVGEVNDMLLKVCGEAANESVSDPEFRHMIRSLLEKKQALTEQETA